MKLKNRNSILSIGLIFILTAILLPAISSAKKQKPSVNWIKTISKSNNLETLIKIGYPKGWRIFDKKRVLKYHNPIKGSLNFYYRHYLDKKGRPSKGWAHVTIKLLNHSSESYSKWPLDEFLKDKDCNVLKCYRSSYKKYPPTVINKSCDSHSKPYSHPQMMGGNCGHFIKKISVSGGPGYLFRIDDEYVDYQSTSLIFKKGKNIYSMAFYAHKDEFSYFGKFFNIFIDNFKAYTRKP